MTAAPATVRVDTEGVVDAHRRIKPMAAAAVDAHAGTAAGPAAVEAEGCAPAEEVEDEDAKVAAILHLLLHSCWFCGTTQCCTVGGMYTRRSPRVLLCNCARGAICVVVIAGNTRPTPADSELCQRNSAPQATPQCLTALHGLGPHVLNTWQQRNEAVQLQHRTDNQ